TAPPPAVRGAVAYGNAIAASHLSPKALGDAHILLGALLERSLPPCGGGTGRGGGGKRRAHRNVATPFAFRSSCARMSPRSTSFGKRPIESPPHPYTRVPAPILRRARARRPAGSRASETARSR